jgi:hypothetical protein
MQCCGKPFSLGVEVAWTLGAADPDWLEMVLGTRAQQTVDAAEDHHGGVPGDHLGRSGIRPETHAHVAPVDHTNNT